MFIMYKYPETAHHSTIQYLQVVLSSRDLLSVQPVSPPLACIQFSSNEIHRLPSLDDNDPLPPIFIPFYLACPL